jgi:formylglycine-generating enzyme required for sulfatase activity
MRSALLLTFALAACDPPLAPAQGHILLHVDTDAPVDTGSREATIDQPLPLFDRLRFDILRPNGEACAGCTNEFSVTTDAFTSKNVSIDVPLPPGEAGWKARVRLYPLDFAGADGEPDPATAIDVTVPLPAVDVTGEIEASIVLHTDDVGKPRTIAAVPRPPPDSIVGTWEGAKRPDCGGATHAGMVCVPGGAFWMGSPPDDHVPGTVPGWHRLVVLSPFFLDATEMTVARARPTIEAKNYILFVWSGDTTGNVLEDWCSYTHAPGPRDALPVNCIDPMKARSICSDLGGVLPTEAQLEYVMGGLAMKRFVWGMDLPLCGDAVWGRNGVGVFKSIDPSMCLPDAMALGTLGGFEKPGTGKRDVLALDGTIVDLTGNVAEWSSDWYQPYSGDCWSADGVLVDPQCQTENAKNGNQIAERGGSWGSGGVSLEAASRRSSISNGLSPYTGFRCARPVD